MITFYCSIFLSLLGVELLGTVAEILILVIGVSMTELKLELKSVAPWETLVGDTKILANGVSTTELIWELKSVE